MRCMSAAPGSATSARRCMRMPIWRCSRTACCAAATDPGRPIVNGSTSPGNSTVLRTGTMISASVGTGGRLPAPAPCPSREAASATESLRLAEGDQQTAMNGRAADAAVAAGWQAHAPLEAALRQLQPMDDCSVELARQLARAGDDEVGAVDGSLHLVGVDA